MTRLGFNIDFTNLHSVYQVDINIGGLEVLPDAVIPAYRSRVVVIPLYDFSMLACSHRSSFSGYWFILDDFRRSNGLTSPPGLSWGLSISPRSHSY